MQTLDVYTKKTYECKKCGASVYYAKIADDTGKYVTTDGLSPNGKYGKESNVLSAPVGINNTSEIHGCAVQAIQEKYNSYVSPPKKEVITDNTTQVKVRWPEEPKQLTDLQSELYHGYHDLTAIAYMLTREQHPHLPEDSDTFGMIVHAKSLVLSNLVIAKSFKKNN